MTQILYVLVGVPGSGKSTWANSRFHRQMVAYISTDTYVEKHAESIGKTYSEVFDEYMPTAVNMMTHDVVRARESLRTIVWDQTSTTIASRAKKLNMLPKYYPIAVVFRTPEMHEHVRRLMERPNKMIPIDVLESMVENFEEPTFAEGFREIIYVNNESTLT